jgi:hypothetical protein
VVSFKPRSLYPEERGPVTRWVGDWVVSRADLDAVLTVKLRLVSRLACGQALYRLLFWLLNLDLHKNVYGLRFAAILQ